MKERAFLLIFEIQCLSLGVIWRLARASDQWQLATGLRMQGHLFTIRQLIVFNFSINGQVARKVHVNKNNCLFGKFILLLTGFGLLQQRQKNRYCMSIL
jgi:hypothetical protein